MSECKIICVCNQKGGIGKSSLVNALSIGLARKNYRVLAVDMDPQANLSMSMGVTFPDLEENTIANIMLSRLQGQPAGIEQSSIRSNFGVDFVIGNDDLGKVDRMLSGFRDSEFLLSEIIADIKQEYGYIIFDTAPNIGNLTENAIIAADEIIIPSEPQFFSTKGIQSLFNEIESIRHRKNPQLRITGILPTKVDMRTNITKDFIETINQIFQDKVHIFQSYIPLSVKLSECNDGKNIYEYDKNGKGVQAYLSFVDEFLQRMEG